MLRSLMVFCFPVLELYVLVKVGGLIGAFNTVLWVFASAALGVWALRAHGRGIMNRVNQELAQGRVPQEAMLHGLLLFIAGVLLILPGFISDAIGLLLLIPFVRTLTLHLLSRYFAGQVRQAGHAEAGSAKIFFYSSSSGFGVPTSETSHPDAGDSGPRQATVIESTATVLSEPETDSPQGGDTVGETKSEAKSGTGSGMSPTDDSSAPSVKG